MGDEKRRSIVGDVKPEDFQARIERIRALAGAAADKLTPVVSTPEAPEVLLSPPAAQQTPAGADGKFAWLKGRKDSSPAAHSQPREKDDEIIK